MTNFKSSGIDIPVELFSPTTTPNGGVIIIAYGSDGMTDNLTGPWGTMIKGFGKDLVDRGFVVSIPDYFQRTVTLPGTAAFQQIRLHRDLWLTTMADAVSHATSLPDVDASRVGLIGFSLGGHLCLRLRATAKALVEFFAPELDGLGPSKSISLHAQIHHGKADNLVPFEPNATNIDRELRSNGASVELFSYTGAGHGFTGSDASNASAFAQSKARTISFFEKHL